LPLSLARCVAANRPQPGGAFEAIARHPRRAQAGPDWRGYGSPASQSSSEPSLMSANSGVEK
jgi:hypothetical protein